MPALDLFWYDGGMTPELPADIKAANIRIGSDGMILFIGDEGKIYAEFRGASPRLFTSRGNEPLFPQAAGARGGGGQGARQRGGAGGAAGAGGGESERMPVWQSAVEGGAQSPGSFLKAGPISDTVCLWGVALRARKKVLFDSASMKITNADDANQFLVRKYRAGWEL